MSTKIVLKRKPQAPQLQKLQSIYYAASTPANHCSQQSCKIAAFDLDATLIQYRSNSQETWTWLDPTVPNYLRQLQISGWQLVIFTNQHGLSKGTTTVGELQTLYNEISRELAPAPIAIYIATARDHYRKPMIGMWNLYLQHQELTVNDVNWNESFYCGDAAGRKGDFNITDRYFASNCGLIFKTPPQAFGFPDLAPQYQDHYLTDLDIRQYDATHIPIFTIVTAPSSESANGSNQKHVVIMIGPIASGKSTISQLCFGNYVRINNDTTKSLHRSQLFFTNALLQGKNVVIDNTNPDRAKRQHWIEEAQQSGYSISAIYLDFPKLLSIHLNQMRIHINGSGNGATPSALVPIIAIHTYYKQLQPPQLDEGFSEIITIDKLYQMSNIDTQLFRHYYYYHYDLKGQ